MSSTSPSPNIAGPSGEPVNGGPGVGAAPAPLWVDALGDSGALLGSVRVSHGEHPEAALARAGWAAIDVLAAGLGPSLGIVLRYAARRLPAASAFASGASGEADHVVARQGSARPLAVDGDLVLAPGEHPVRVQRVAAYALVRSARGVLLTQLSARTNAAGLWTLPGGGLEPGEDPVAGLRREVHEETGQSLTVGSLLGIVDGHWVGRSPTGRAEDFHAVRLLYLADCPEPTDPIVHEIDGTTAAAAWVPPATVPGLRLSPTWRAVLTDWLVG